MVIKMNKPQDEEDNVSYIPQITTLIQYAIAFALGHILDFLSIFTFNRRSTKEGYTPLLMDFEDFWTRRLYSYIADAWNRPISSVPGSWIRVMDREPIYNDKIKQNSLTGTERWMLNLGSYNYLGFADPDSPCIKSVLQSLDKYGVSTVSRRSDLGTTRIHSELELLVAEFVGKPAAMVFSMGFGTNTSFIPLLVGKGGLIISDSLNHSSIVVGSRFAGTKIKVFKHGDLESLESVIRTSIIEGQPRTHRPWTKIVILVEGIYSMEGDLSPLREIVALKKKYNCYLYVDEAHSIGALGRRGRGICDQLNIDTKDVDFLMGTFTKSFGSVGGYVASSVEMIEYARHACNGYVNSNSISPPAAQQVIAGFNVIMGRDGTDLGIRKIRQLKENSNYFRNRLIEMGCHVLGEADSPIIPVMLLHPTKIIAFSRECYKRRLAVVVVGFPATPLLLSRARFCISAAHTREDLDFAAEQINEVVNLLHLRYKTHTEF